MNITRFRVTEDVINNIEKIYKNKKEKVEFEETMKISLLRETGEDPAMYDLNIVRNHTANTFDFILTRRENV